eukprot:GEMP01024895.1.p1 GENE.GEMP01024895.1~~GEMP01024895.1.p1  ORF type:complete len:307 (+),score=30.24 GEMP01024895.1:91-1011(+)
MQSWAPLVESVVVPLGICLAAAGLFLLFWLARDRPKAVWAAPKQYFRGSRYSLAWMQKISCGICFQVAFMVTLFLFTVDFDRQAMSTRLYVLLNSTLLLFLTVAVVGGVMCFIVRNDLLLLFVVFGSSSGFVAICSGMMLYDTYVVTSRLASEGKHFVGVSPRSHAAGYRDAGTIEFAPLAVLDLERAVGYKSGSTYCAAPIVQDYTDTTPVQFWAIGTNCCSSRGTFTCASQTYPLCRTREWIGRGALHMISTAAQWIWPAPTYRRTLFPSSFPSAHHPRAVIQPIILPAIAHFSLSMMQTSSLW